MRILVDLYGIDEVTSKALYFEGLINPTIETAYQVFLHYTDMLKVYRNKRKARKDCLVHFKIKDQTFYRYIQLIKAVHESRNL